MPPRATKLAILNGCVLLPLTPHEKSLLRTVITVYRSGTERAWGEANPHRYDEVAALFTKCENILASQAAV